VRRDTDAEKSPRSSRLSPDGVTARSSQVSDGAALLLTTPEKAAELARRHARASSRRRSSAWTR
jgi:hypothetical protein